MIIARQTSANGDEVGNDTTYSSQSVTGPITLFPKWQQSPDSPLMLSDALE
jgi:hypothetical protein